MRFYVFMRVCIRDQWWSYRYMRFYVFMRVCIRDQWCFSGYMRFSETSSGSLYEGLHQETSGGGSTDT